jgi:hypothetical protein
MEISPCAIGTKLATKYHIHMCVIVIRTCVDMIHGSYRLYAYPTFVSSSHYRVLQHSKVLTRKIVLQIYNPKMFISFTHALKITTPSHLRLRYVFVCIHPYHTIYNSRTLTTTAHTRTPGRHGIRHHQEWQHIRKRLVGPDSP